MKISSTVILFCCLAFRPTASWAEEKDADEIINKSRAAYAALETYQAEGTTVVNRSGTGVKLTTKTTFTIKMKKPHQYLIRCDQKITSSGPSPPMSLSGIVWNDGTQPLFLSQSTTPQGTTHYLTKAGTNDWALEAGLTMTDHLDATARMFAPTERPPEERLSGFYSLVEPKLQGSERIAGEDCYVIGHRSKMFKKETYWISKSTFFIRQYFHLTTVADELLAKNCARVVDAKIAEMEKQGQTVTPQQRDAMIKKDIQDYPKGGLEGSATTVYAKIGTPPLTDADFVVKVPEDAVLKE